MTIFARIGLRKLFRRLKNQSEDSSFSWTIWKVLSMSFKSEISKLGSVLWYGGAGVTDVWHPIDPGYGKLYKTLVGQFRFQGIEIDDNVEFGKKLRENH